MTIINIFKNKNIFNYYLLNIQMELQRHIKHAIYSIVKRLLKDNWTIKVRNLLKPT